jgi:cysteine desulfurase
VPLIVGLGKAAELGAQHHAARDKQCRAFRENFLQSISVLQPKIHGEESQVLPHTVNASFPGLSAEEAMLRLKDVAAVSNGSACTSASYQPSHVLKAMHLAKEEIIGAIRFSWSHLTPEPDWKLLAEKLRG